MLSYEIRFGRAYDLRLFCSLTVAVINRAVCILSQSSCFLVFVELPAECVKAGEQGIVASSDFFKIVKIDSFAHHFTKLAHC